VATDLGWLWSLLRREGQAGATNLISGGMDAAMRAAIRGESRNSVVRRIYRNLPASGYAALGLDDRKLWLQRALATIEIEQSSENTRTTPLSRSGKKKGNHIFWAKKNFSGTGEEKSNCPRRTRT
jgi:hypothetical protein